MDPSAADYAVSPLIPNPCFVFNLPTAPHDAAYPATLRRAFARPDVGERKYIALAFVWNAWPTMIHGLSLSLASRSIADCV